MSPYDIALQMKDLMDSGMSLATAVNLYLEEGYSLDVVEQAYSLLLDDPTIGVISSQPFNVPGVVIYE